MNNQTIVCCVVALILGMLLANMLKSICGCKNVVEGQCAKDECWCVDMGETVPPQCYDAKECPDYSPSDLLGPRSRCSYYGDQPQNILYLL